MSEGSKSLGGLLAILPLKEREALEQRARVVSFAAGEALMHEGEAGDRALILLGGRAKVSCATRSGRSVMLAIRGPGDLIGDLSAIDRRPRSSSVEALEPVEALALAASELRALIMRRPELAAAMLEMLSDRFRDAERKRIEFGASNTAGRVAARVVELADRYGEARDEGIVIALPISQEDLAGWCSTSRASVASALRELRELGWIETARGRVVVRDLAELRLRASV